MEMSGKKLAEPIIENVRKRVEKLGKKNIIPELAIVTVGGEDAWFSYVNQKLKTAQKLGIRTRAIHLDGKNEQQLLEKINQLNNDKNVNGIIVQRPLPENFEREKIIKSINPEKDIDGFREDSPFEVPVVLAVKDFIREAYGVITASELKNVLINQSICVVGKGETAGFPIIKWLHTQGAVPTIIDTKTINVCQELKRASLIISATGKGSLIKPECLMQNSVLIGIGIRRESEKLIGDYKTFEVRNIVRAYTPTPGGVGPLNLAYLFKNLLDATEKQSN